jgi:hypothetical protein
MKQSAYTKDAKAWENEYSANWGKEDNSAQDTQWGAETHKEDYPVNISPQKNDLTLLRARSDRIAPITVGVLSRYPQLKGILDIGDTAFQTISIFLMKMENKEHVIWFDTIIARKQDISNDKPPMDGMPTEIATYELRKRRESELLDWLFKIGRAAHKYGITELHTLIDIELVRVAKSYLTNRSLEKKLVQYSIHTKTALFLTGNTMKLAIGG